MGHMTIITGHCTYLLPLWWDIWSSLLDILHFITLVMGHMTIITGHFTFYFPCDGTYDHHYWTLHILLPLWWDKWLSLRDIAPIYYPCDGTYDHHYWTFCILLPLWWDKWPSLRDIAPFYYPCDGTNDHHYGTLYPFIPLVMRHMTLITGHCILYCTFYICNVAMTCKANTCQRTWTHCCMYVRHK